MKQPAREPKGAGERVLIVDDDQDLNQMVKLRALKEGYLVDQAFDGGAALERIKANRPHLVVLDIMLPVLDGRDVLKRLKADPATRDIRVLVFSARGEQSDRRVGLELGADDYVEKPFNLEQLMGKIQYQLWKAKGG